MMQKEEKCFYQNPNLNHRSEYKIVYIQGDRSR